MPELNEGALREAARSIREHNRIHSRKEPHAVFITQYLEFAADLIEKIAEGKISLTKQRRGQLDEDRPLTNADRIRQMTDEELAKMVDMRVCRIVKPDGKDCPKGFYFGKCDKCVLKWLKQEVSEDAAD